MAGIAEADTNVILSTETSDLSAVTNSDHGWLVDSAASSHLSGNRSLFYDLHVVEPISVETSSGESFVSSKRGTVYITMYSVPQFHLPDLSITLQEVIYVPNFKAYLLSVGRMTNAKVDVKFSGEV